MTSPAQVVDRILGLAEVRHTAYQGGQIFWLRWPSSRGGSATPLILLHGGFGSWNHWIRNVEALSLERDVWALDLPGLGRSGEMPEPHSTDHFARIVLTGIDELLGGQSPFALAGFSFGALIGGRLASIAGARCTRCTVIGAAGFGALHVQVPLLPPPTPDASAEAADAILRENLARLMLFRPEAIDDLAVQLHGDNLARHRFRSRKMAGSNELAELLPKITAPLVGIWGEKDATAGGYDAIEARRDLFMNAQPGAAFHILQDVGHWAMYEAPDPINAILSADLDP